MAANSGRTDVILCSDPTTPVLLEGTVHRPTSGGAALVISDGICWWVLPTALMSDEEVATPADWGPFRLAGPPTDADIAAAAVRGDAPLVSIMRRMPTAGDLLERATGPGWYPGRVELDLVGTSPALLKSGSAEALTLTHQVVGHEVVYGWRVWVDHQGMGWVEVLRGDGPEIDAYAAVGAFCEGI